MGGGGGYSCNCLAQFYVGNKIRFSRKVTSLIQKIYKMHNNYYGYDKTES